MKYIILDDASDPTNAAKNARKLVTEDKVDALMGSNGVPSAVQMAQVAAESKTPIVVLTPANLSAQVLQWSFVLPQTTELMMGAIAEHIKAKNLKTIGYIGYSDTLGRPRLQGARVARRGMPATSSSPTSATRAPTPA